MLVSFVFSAIFVAVVFPTKSPRVRPQLTAYLATKFTRTAGTIVQNLKNSIPSLSKNNPKQTSPEGTVLILDSNQALVALEESLKEIPFNTDEKGIYSKSDTNFSYMLIKEKEVDWMEKHYSVEGKDVKVLTLKGEELDQNGMNAFMR